MAIGDHGAEASDVIGMKMRDQDDDGLHIFQQTF